MIAFLDHIFRFHRILFSTAAGHVIQQGMMLHHQLPIRFRISRQRQPNQFLILRVILRGCLDGELIFREIVFVMSVGLLPFIVDVR